MDFINPRQIFADALMPYACRRVDLARAGSLADNPIPLAAGDLALAEVLTPGANQHLVLADGRSQRLARGQMLIVTLGSPYAPLAHTGRVPAELGECDLLTANGVAGIEIARAQKLAAPTRLRLYGVLGDARGAKLNLSQFALPAAAQADSRSALLAARPKQSWLVLSTARRTQTSAAMLHLVHGLTRHQTPLAALKLTGELDADFASRLHHAGATWTLDIADAGFAASGGVDGPSLLAAADRLLAHATTQGAEIALTRVAGGLAQREVRALLATPGFALRFDGVLLTAADALSARAGVATLQALGLPVRVVSGALCESPLAMREALPLPCPLIAPEDLAEAPGLAAFQPHTAALPLARAA